MFHESQLVVGVWDGYPVSPGHALLVPRRHVADWFAASEDERAALMQGVEAARKAIERLHAPQGYNVGINIGRAAGQTVEHLHVHVIPRYRGDVPDPTGGVRSVIADKANYLRERAAPLSTGAPDDPFLAHVAPLLASAHRIDIVAAFIQQSGLVVLQSGLISAMHRGAQIRVIAGDYLDITQVDALQRLLDWTEEARALTADETEDDAEAQPGPFEARVVEMARLEAKSFHPKAWLFTGDGFGTAFVGSSNVSEPALKSGVEWNLRVDRERDSTAFARVEEAIESLWNQATPLSPEWVAAYRERARLHRQPLPPGEAEPETPPPPPAPHEIQEAALQALEQSRNQGRKRALVVMATGLGKTYLAALDACSVRGTLGDDSRVLVVAHRAELLRQAAETFRRLLPSARFGWFVGSANELEGDIVFASVQKLSRAEHLMRLAPDAFHYVVIDEVHHAAASSYRRILAHLEPEFLLGLTATPDRADEADILGLFDDHEAFRADLGDGIDCERLVPFRYFGLADTVDYRPIPWRNGRFDPAMLVEAVQTQQRMERLWEAWTARPRERTLVFCCSIAHTGFVTEWLNERGVATEAVHSGEKSADRADAVRRLAAGELAAVCTVDLFNEGIDIPAVDRVVMLRPTESPVVFLQQLGRGLRSAPDKDHLLVIDFVGNHRMFLERMRNLLSLAGRLSSVRELLDGAGKVELPSGCAVDVELEAVDMLRALLGDRAPNETIRLYRELRGARGTRPHAGELWRMGRNPRSLKHPGGWFGFVRDENDLTPPELEAHDVAGAWLEHLEKSAMTKCFKIVTLEVLLEADALDTGMSLAELARRAHAILSRSPDLMVDIEGVRELPDPHQPDPNAWLAYWNKNPIAAWTRGRWFELDAAGERLVSRIPMPPEASERQAVYDMTAELVDFRLAVYRTRLQSNAGGSAFETRVTWNKRDPILKLPSRKKRPDIPSGELAVRLEENGEAWSFRMMKEFCNVARPIGASRNQLPDLMRRWFGPSAGHPGTAFSVRFYPTADDWWVEPVGARIVEMPTRGRVPYFPDLEAAAGVTGTQIRDVVGPTEVVLPIKDGDAADFFAVRAVGDSMDGGSEPIRDGDWVVMRWARSEPLSAVEGRVCLVAVGDAEAGMSYHLKRVATNSARAELRSDNPNVAAIDANANTVVHAVATEIIRPEQLAPDEGTLVTGDELTARFGLSERPSKPFARVDGHLFILVEAPGLLVAPDRVQIENLDRRSGETAYIHCRADSDEPWRYCGVGRRLNGLWSVLALDYRTWKALGTGRAASRTLKESWIEYARNVVRKLMASPGPGQWVAGRDKRCRLVGPAPRGGLRIDGGEGGFAERTVSLSDLGWALKARAAFDTGTVLDEACVNRVRYPESTPQSSTRWIDTGWAILLVEAAQ